MQEPFGNYTLLERIAVGGMAEVFLARAEAEPGRPEGGSREEDPRPALPARGRGWRQPLQEIVVVKRMLPQLAESAEHVTMFLDEAKLGALLKHDNIVDVLDIGQVGTSWYMALEYVDGPDLGQILRTARDARSLLPVPLAAWVIARAADGLHFAHHVLDPKTGAPLGLVHRDVSPQNILVSRGGAVKVGDFGVAKSDVQMHQTQTGLVKGKIGYMSPEQLSAQELDARSDVLALGVCLWEALTHKRLYSGLSDVQVMKKIYFDTPPPPSLAGAPVDAALDEIVLKALARKRDERYASARDLAGALDAWCEEKAVEAGRDALAAWMNARFVPRATLAEAATAWAYKSPARGTESVEGDADVDATETTEVDVAPMQVVGEGPAAQSSPKSPTATPRKTLPKGTILRPLSRAPQKPQPKRDLVLYVEDEQQNWEVAELLLKKNYDLVHAPDDQMACEILRTRGRELTAVLMDIQLKGSELDGIGLVKLIRGAIPVDQVPSYARGVVPLQVPIFFVTAYAARYSEKELLAVGADKLVTKPVDFTQLTLALTSYQLRRAAQLSPG